MYEFDYDLVVWVGMEQFLDSILFVVGSNVGNWWVSVWKWLLLAGLILVGGMWWMVNWLVVFLLQGSLLVSIGKEDIQFDKDRENDVIFLEILEWENNFNLGIIYIKFVWIILVIFFCIVVIYDFGLFVVKWVFFLEFLLLFVWQLLKVLMLMIVK